MKTDGFQDMRMSKLKENGELFFKIFYKFTLQPSVVFSKNFLDQSIYQLIFLPILLPPSTSQISWENCIVNFLAL